MPGDISDLLKQSLSAADIDVEQILAKAELEIAETEVATQVTTADNQLNVFEEVSNPMAAQLKRADKSLESRKATLTKAQIEKLEQKIVSIKESEGSADKFCRQNPEFKKQILLLLLDKIKDAKTKEDVLEILKQFYPDATLADDALRFLLENTLGDLKKIIEEAKQFHEENFGREIKAGQNIADEVQKYVSAGLGAPTRLRDMYRDITGNPRDPVVLFLEFSDRFPYKELRKVLAFLFHSLGSDLKSQGPSIEPGLLHRLLQEVRSLQAVLGVYQFFLARMKLIAFLFEREGMEMPKNLNFELLAKQFVTLLQERYPTGDKVLQMAGKLGIEKWILAKIIVFSQLRDAIREVALNQLYRSVQHRDELYNAIIEALENLEEELDEYREKEEEERERQESVEEEEEQEAEEEKKKKKK
jgi:type III secretion protein W